MQATASAGQEALTCFRGATVLNLMSASLQDEDDTIRTVAAAAISAHARAIGLPTNDESNFEGSILDNVQASVALRWCTILTDKKVGLL